MKYFLSSLLLLAFSATSTATLTIINRSSDPVILSIDTKSSTDIYGITRFTTSKSISLPHNLEQISIPIPGMQPKELSITSTYTLCINNNREISIIRK